METDEIRKLLDDTFEELAFVLEGIFTVHGIDDEVVWQTMKHLGIAHDGALAKLDGTPSRSGRGKARDAGPHPAVEALLLQLKARRNTKGHE